MGATNSTCTHQTPNWDQLPDELLCHIFTFLPYRDRAVCAQVSKRWCHFAHRAPLRRLVWLHKGPKTPFAFDHDQRWADVRLPRPRTTLWKTLDVGLCAWARTITRLGVAERCMEGSSRVRAKTLEGILSQLPNLVEIHVYAGGDAVCLALGEVGGRLKSLTVERMSDHDSLPLDLCKNMRELRLMTVERLRSLDELSVCRGLKHVYLHNLPNLSSLEPLSTLPTLTFLDISNLPRASFSPIGDCVALRDLSMCVWPIRWNDLTPLKRCTDITRLYLSVGDLPSLEGIQSLRSLAHMTAQLCGQLADVSALALCTGLTDLSITCTKINNVQWLTDCGSHISKLNLSNNWQLTSLSGLSACTRLSSLDIAFCRDLSSLSGLSPECASLRAFSSGNCRNLTDISGLEQVPYLTSLYLLDCSAVADFNPLSALTGLVNIDLSGCTQIKNLDFLTAPNLYDIKASNLNQLTSLSGLSRSPLLRSAVLSGCVSLSSIAPLSSCTHLFYVDVSECACLSDLTPLNRRGPNSFLAPFVRGEKCPGAEGNKMVVIESMDGRSVNADVGLDKQ